ncbi:MAG: hypothetical protein IJ317_04745 [Clostridia bacterium]|nr:hypothetical protein [Clostridia bacterium]
MAEHGGHRRRLLQKLSAGKLCEHEYLELLLFNAMPRRNTNDLAHRLLAEFGTVYGIFTAPLERLIQVDGIGENIATYLLCIGHFFRRYEDSKTELQPCGIAFYETAAFLAYIKKEYAQFPYERLDVYLLDANSKIIGKKSHTVLNVGRVYVEPEFFLKLLLPHSPSGIVIVHNHPKGTCAPSQRDDATTEHLKKLCQLHNVLFCDHFVYGSDGIYSYGNNKRFSFSAESEAKER